MGQTLWSPWWVESLVPGTAVGINALEPGKVVGCVTSSWSLGKLG